MGLMPDKDKKTILKTKWNLHMNGMAWSPAALDLAHGLIRTHGRVSIVNLPAPLAGRIEFNKHPALDRWSDAQLKPQKT
jgi:hypothetical protein